MANFCLPKELTDVFKLKLKSGELDPAKLVELSSDERRAVFAKLVGEGNAKQVNALFESKLLLKNQQQGMINWAKKVLGQKPEVLRDTLAKVNRMTEVLQPKDMNDFLSDLAEQRLGVSVSMKEASLLVERAKEIAVAKEKMLPDNTFSTFEDRMGYGRALVKFNNLVEDLKVTNDKLTFERLKNNPLGTAGEGLVRFGGLTKSIKASLDNSVIGRQGLKVLFTNPKIWKKNSIQTFKDMFNTYKGKEVMDEVKAEVLSRPNAINGNYLRQKLAVGVVEEAFPTSLPSKIPVLGRAFKASENAFTAFQYRTRADIFDKYLQVAEKTGADTKGIGILANSLTGRGRLPFSFEKNADTFNSIFFAPRFVKSNIDALTGNLLDYGHMGSFAKKQAAVNSLKIVGGIASVLAIADAMLPGSVEKDPKSADFGKIRIGDTRFDVSGGMAPFVVLASRLLTGKTKSSTTGKTTELNSGKFGSQTKIDLILNFGLGKLSPVAGVVRDLMQDRTFKGDKPTVANQAMNLFSPIGLQNYLELKDNPNSANIVIAMIADALGIGTNTYSKK